VTVVWNVQASDSQRVIANGTPAGTDSLNYGHTTWHYRLDAPVPLDALAVAVGHYAVTTLAHASCRRACVPVTLWTSPADSAAAAAGAFRRAADILDFMSARLGPFP
jgi:aminopeptidase N